MKRNRQKALHHLLNADIKLNETIACCDVHEESRTLQRINEVQEQLRIAKEKLTTTPYAE